MLKRLAHACIWPLCLAANTAPVVAAAVLAPELLPQTAAVTTLTMIVALVALERVLPEREDWTIHDDGDLWRDVGHALLYAALAVNIARVLFLGLLGAAIARSGVANELGMWPSSWPVWLQIVLVIVLGDGLEYLYHRLCHAVPLLWRLHAIHHTPVRLHTLKGGRHHVLYAFGRAVMVWLPLLLLGAPAALIYWQFVAETITGLAGHANVRFAIPACMHRVLVTPQFHRIHHAANPRLGNSNFGVVFPFWDMVFGTHNDPREIAVGVTGIEDDPIPRRFVEELKSPFTYRALVAQSKRDANA